MIEHVLPVRAGADSWAFHHESGALDRLRCVVPRPAGFRHGFKSAIDYLPARSAAQRAMPRLSGAGCRRFTSPWPLGLRPLGARGRVHLDTDRSNAACPVRVPREDARLCPLEIDLDDVDGRASCVAPHQSIKRHRANGSMRGTGVDR
jgi:hypothetical protein